MSQPVNQAPYLLTSRQIPQDPTRLQPELTKSFYDIASAVNVREISTYEKVQTNTGQRWYGLSVDDASVKRQAFRRVYDTGALPNTGFKDIPLGFDVDAGFQLTKLYGAAQNGTSWIPLPFVDGSGAIGNVGAFIINASPSVIRITTSTAAFVAYSGVIVIEYILSN